jgi:hypothetical protein
MSKCCVLLLSLLMTIVPVPATAQSGIFETYEHAEGRAPDLTYEEDRTITGDQGGTETLSFRLSLYGTAGTGMPLLVQVHEWGGSFAREEDLAPAAADQVVVGTTAELTAAIDQANSGGPTTILLADGTYTIDLAYGMAVAADGVTVRSLSGNREAVIIEGDGMYGSVSHIFQVSGSNFTARDMTLRGVANHIIQIHGEDDADAPVLSNLHILDGYEQLVKISYQAASPVGSDNGVLEDCLLEYSAGIGPQFYIGGIDCHRCSDWIIRDNTFRYITSPADEVAEHAVHFWSDSSGTVVERNLIIDCDRGVGFGLGDRGHQGGIIRNNMIYHSNSGAYSDVGIALESTTDAQVYNNTILFEHGYENAIEVRHAISTGVAIHNNLSNRRIAERDGAVATISHNNTGADRIWFADPSTGDLHLAMAITTVVDQGLAISGLSDDFDGDPRPQGDGIDIGADEYRTDGSPPVAAFSWSPQSPLAGQAVQFEDLSSPAPSSWSWSFGDGGSSTISDPSHTYSRAGTYSVTLTVGNAFGSDSLSRNLTVAASGQTPPVTDPGAHAYVVPAAARVSGALGTSWVTDMVLNNGESAAATAHLYLLVRAQDNRDATGIQVQVAAGTSLRLDDVVASVFGRSDTSGAIIIGSDQHLVVTSRTYNDQGEAAGTYGQFIPGVRLDLALGEGDPARLVQLTHNSRYRTNIGMVNLTSRTITVDLYLYRGNGGSLGNLSYRLAPYEYDQDNDVIGDLTSAAVDDAFAVVNSDTTGARFFAYASIVDNRSGDAIYIPATQ